MRLQLARLAWNFRRPSCPYAFHCVPLCSTVLKCVFACVFHDGKNTQEGTRNTFSPLAPMVSPGTKPGHALLGPRAGVRPKAQPPLSRQLRPLLHRGLCGHRRRGPKVRPVRWILTTPSPLPSASWSLRASGWSVRAEVGCGARRYGQAEGGGSDEDLFRAVAGEIRPPWPRERFGNQARWAERIGRLCQPTSLKLVLTI
eukprot:1152667-Pyramimonas_sp.AAC.1